MTVKDYSRVFKVLQLCGQTPRLPGRRLKDCSALMIPTLTSSSFFLLHASSGCPPLSSCVDSHHSAARNPRLTTHETHGVCVVLKDCVVWSGLVLFCVLDSVENVKLVGLCKNQKQTLFRREKQRLHRDDQRREWRNEQENPTEPFTLIHSHVPSIQDSTYFSITLSRKKL